MAKLILDIPEDLIDPCPACLPYIEKDDTACDHCDKKPLKDDYFSKLAKLHIILDPSKVYIIKDGKCREVVGDNIREDINEMIEEHGHCCLPEVTHGK
jgi:hypothetical protein